MILRSLTVYEKKEEEKKHIIINESNVQLDTHRKGKCLYLPVNGLSLNTGTATAISVFNSKAKLK